MRFLIIFSVALLSVQADNDADLRWAQFKIKFNKQYGPLEFRARRNFENNVKLIKNHNMEAADGLHSFTLGINQFTDMTNQEVNDIYNGYRSFGFPKNKANAVFEPDYSAPLPLAVDWRKKKLVTPVKDQGACGSCWAFSAVGSMEGQHAKLNGKLVSLSERQLVDCSFAFGNLGCLGGQMDNAFKYVISNNGSDTEKSYPYTDILFQTCKKTGAIGARIKKFVDIKSGDEKALMAAVATIGPISVAIDASKPSFKAYKTGVYYEPSCSSTQLDHGVTLVGYGTDNGKNYWLVKNSWNTTWGDAGYIKMSRNKNNNCGIATMASYPIALA